LKENTIKVIHNDYKQACVGMYTYMGGFGGRLPSANDGTAKGLTTIFFISTDTTITGMKNDSVVLETERNMQILGLV
jgi:hypothetical protein